MAERGGTVALSASTIVGQYELKAMGMLFMICEGRWKRQEAWMMEAWRRESRGDMTDVTCKLRDISTSFAFRLSLFRKLRP